MAFGFSPKYIQEFNLDNLDKEHFLVAAIDAALKLNWEVAFISETGFIAYTKFSMSSWSEEVTVKIAEGKAIIKSECNGSQMIDWGKNKKNVEAFISAIREVRSSLTAEEIEQKSMALKQHYVPKEEDILNRPPSTAKEKITDFFSIFKPTEGYFISPILIDINILVFLAMLISGVHVLQPDNQSLIDWGANFKPLTLEGEWWRLFTACFLHIGILHLLLNMYALLYVGLLLEPYLGKARFLAAYLISGIAASMASLWWHDFTVSAGASGAIFGMYGVFLALLTTNLLDKSVKNALMTSIMVFVVFNIFNGLQEGSGIDNAAHIGGLLSGLIIGYAFVPSLKKFDNVTLKLSTIGALTLVLLASSVVAYKTMPNDIVIYEKGMNQFSDTENKALEILKIPETAHQEELLSALKDKGIPYWKQNIRLIESLEKLNLPDWIKERNLKLKEYSELRLQTYELHYKTIKENTNSYIAELENCNQKIETIIDELAQKK